MVIALTHEHIQHTKKKELMFIGQNLVQLKVKVPEKLWNFQETNS